MTSRKKAKQKEQKCRLPEQSKRRILTETQFVLSNRDTAYPDGVLHLMETFAKSPEDR
jgi:hypothetical protein